MKVNWTKGLSEQDKAAMKTAFLSSSLVRERVILLANEKIKISQKERISKEGYDASNWAYKQADACGYERALTEIISLFTV